MYTKQYFYIILCSFIHRYPPLSFTSEPEDLWVRRWVMSPMRAPNSLPRTVGAWRDVLAAHAFRVALFCCAAVVLRDSALRAPLVIWERHCWLSWASGCQESTSMSNALSEALRESLLRFSELPQHRSPYRSCFCSLWSSILATWLAHLSCAFGSNMWLLEKSARLSTSVSGILFLHLIRKSLRRQVIWKLWSCRACLM